MFWVDANKTVLYTYQMYVYVLCKRLVFIGNNTKDERRIICKCVHAHSFIHIQIYKQIDHVYINRHNNKFPFSQVELHSTRALASRVNCNFPLCRIQYNIILRIYSTFIYIYITICLHKKYFLTHLQLNIINYVRHQRK